MKSTFKEVPLEGLLSVEEHPEVFFYRKLSAYFLSNDRHNFQNVLFRPETHSQTSANRRRSSIRTEFLVYPISLEEFLLSIDEFRKKFCHKKTLRSTINTGASGIAFLR